MAEHDLRAVGELGDEEYEEIRLALVMTGGSSLAVWMGGVTNEINKLRLAEGPYGEILGLLHATARVDVISGTSAGGLNGAVMGMAVSRENSDLGSLRTLWEDSGSFTKLLRDPFQPDSPSLLQGDAYFLKSLREAIEKLAQSPLAEPADDHPVDLMMTGSMLVGRDSAMLDDFGSLIIDSDHKALFRFRRGGVSGHVEGCGHGTEPARADDFASPSTAARLALAARSSASFPVVFEPSLVPIGDDDATPDRPNMRCNANFKTTRYVLDGGVLMNKPIGPALRSIFELPGSRQVRRVLAYVVPDPGERVVEKPPGKDEIPTVLQVGLASLVTLPRNESVAADLAELKRHNDRARLQRETRSLIVTALRTDEVPLERSAERLYRAYLSARARLSVDRILGHLADGISQGPATSRDAPLWNLEPLRKALEKHRRFYLPSHFPVDGDLQTQEWKWGVQATEDIGTIVMDLLRRPLRMANPRRADANLIAARGTLREQRKVVHGVLKRVREIRDREGAGFWRKRAASAIEALGEGGDVLEWANDSFEAWPGPLPGSGYTEADARRELGMLATNIAEALVHGFDSILALTEPEAVLPTEGGRAERLRAVVRALQGDVPEVLRRLLALHVVETVFAAGTNELEQVVELIQISGDTPNGFDGRSEAARKIAGTKLGHFAAFYKRSWRVNDWMWGRLDGAYRLSQVLLDPARLWQLQYGVDELVRALEPIVLGPQEGGKHAVLDDGSPRGWDPVAARAELAFLDQGTGALIPESLPVCTRALARRIQLDILSDELPSLGEAIEIDHDTGASESPEAKAFAREVRQGRRGGVLPPELVPALFAKCTVGEETVIDQMHSDLFVATASKAAAVATSVGQGRHLGVPAVAGVFRFARGTVVALHLMAENALRRSKFGYGLLSLMLAVGAILVAAAAVDDAGSGWILSVGLALLAAGSVSAAIRASALRAIWALLFTAAVAASPELLEAAASWLKATKSGWASEGFGRAGDFAQDNRAAVLIAALFLGPFLLGIAGRGRRLEGFATSHFRVATAAGVVVLALTGAVISFGFPGSDPKPSVVSFELAGSAERVNEIRGEWTADELHDVERLTAWDYVFIVAYVGVISSGVSLSTGLWSRHRRREFVSAGRALAGLVVIAGVLDAIENLVIFRLLGTPPGADAVPLLLRGLATTKFAVVGMSLVYIASGVLVGVVRPRT